MVPHPKDRSSGPGVQNLTAIFAELLRGGTDTVGNWLYVGL